MPRKGRRMTMTHASWFAVALALTACTSARKASVPSGDAGQVSPPSAAPLRARRGHTDVTFFVVSDLHFGYGYPDELARLPRDAVKNPVGLEKSHLKIIDTMNKLAGRAYPPGIGGQVGAPRGVLVTGDLTEWGRVEEWQRFVAYYGLRGQEGPLKIPVFEGIGNHDRVHGPWVEQRVMERHGGRFYSWDWDDLHLVSLGEAPDEEGLAFLRNDLARYEKDVPTVLYFHLPLSGPWSTGNWFGDGDFRSRLGNIVADHRPLTIFHGHHHGIGHYTWNGIDVYKPGAVKDTTHNFSVVHVTDAGLTVARFNYDEDGWEP
jgi:3',5'-cyclic AMP phosphodiesterase CpdA